MFHINKADLPVVRTHKAVIILDLQNNLVSQDGLNTIERPPDYLANISKLVSGIRDVATIVWVKTEFEECRPVNKGTLESESVILGQDVEASHAPDTSPNLSKTSKRTAKILSRMAKRAIAEGENLNDILAADEEGEDNVDSEAFLSAQSSQEMQTPLLSAPVPKAIQDVLDIADTSRDLFYTKTHYSALKSGHLLVTLRGLLMTELYICGALSNTSVYATALDAAKYGFSITLVDDCLGYRSRARHDQALRSLDVATGCDILSCDAIIAQLKKSTASRGQLKKAGLQPPEPVDGTAKDLDKMMDNLTLLPKSAEVVVQSTPEQVTAEQPTDVLPRSIGPVEPVIPLLTAEDAADSDEALPAQPPKAAVVPQNRVINKIKARRRPKGPQAPKMAPAAPTPERIQNDRSRHSSPSPPSTLKTPDRSAGNRLRTRGAKRLPMASDSASPTPSSSDDVEEWATVSPPLLDQKGAFEAEESVNVSTPAAVTEAGGSLQSEVDSSPNSAPVSYCEGDTTVIKNLLPPTLAEGIFQKVKHEVRWQKMYHLGGEVPRLVAVQGEIGPDDSIPVYRHPSDESPPLLAWSPTVLQIKKEVEAKLGHSVNHCLIQLYRGGTDYISEHSDKTLDIEADTYIANVSLGSQRTMTFRGKRVSKDKSASDLQKEPGAPRATQRAVLPHNSMCKMGLMTNMRWLHSIRQDKRRDVEKNAEELAYGGERISLTFRSIATFLDKDQTKIWGQGAVAKHKSRARPVINGDGPEAKHMVEAFGKENRASEFDWPETYGVGFDALHIKHERKVLLSGNRGVDLSVLSMLAHLKLDWVPSQMSLPFSMKEEGAEQQPVVRLTDTDRSRSQVEGHIPLLLYLHTVYSNDGEGKMPSQYSRIFTRLGQAARFTSNDLGLWESYAAKGDYIADKDLTIVDFAFWPCLDEVIAELEEDKYPRLRAYREKMMRLEAVKAALERLEGGNKATDGA